MARNTYLIDCIMFLSMGGTLTLMSVRAQYIYQRFSEIHNFTSNSSTDYCTTDTSEDEKTVANDASRLNIYVEIAMGIPSLFTAILLGSWSDKVGRKIPLCINLFGSCIAGVVMILILIFEWPLHGLIVYGLILGLSGSYLLALNLGMAYLSDVVEPSEKNLRYTLLECSLELGGGLVSFGTGYWIKSSGFLPTTCFATTLLLASLAIVPFLPEKNPDEEIVQEDSINGNCSKDSYQATNVAIKNLPKEESFPKAANVSWLSSVWRLYTKEYSRCDICNPGDKKTSCKHGGGLHKGRVWRLWFYITSFFLFIFVELGSDSFEKMYLISYPLCFSPALLGTSVGFSSVVLSASPLLMKLNQKYIHFHTQTIISLAMFMLVIGLIIKAIARSAYIIFIAIGIGFSGNLTMPLMRSQVSSLVSTSEQGAVFSFLSCVETFSTMVGSVSFLLLYPATLPIYHGFAFLFCAMIMSLSMVLMIVLWAINRRTDNHFSSEERAPLLQT